MYQLVKSTNHRPVNYYWYFISTLWLLFVFLVIANNVFAESKTPIDIFVSVLPQKYFVEKVGGNLVNVHVMVGPGQSPATYEPTPKQMAILSNAKIYFRIGVPFENIWMDKIKTFAPNIVVVDARDGVALRNIETIEVLLDDNTHKHEHVHEHGLKDPHIWTSPLIVKDFMSRFATVLSIMYPEIKGKIKNNYQNFAKEMEQLDKNISNLLLQSKAKRFLVFHPSWGYFADRYGLLQVAIEIEGKAPSAKTLGKIIQFAARENIEAIFVQKQFAQQNAKTVAQAVGADVITVDPLAEDYANNLLYVASQISRAM